MTPSISFEVDRREKVIKIPNSALRFFPQVQRVRKEDQPLLEGRASESQQQEQAPDMTLSAQERAEARRKRSRRHVWMQEGAKLRAIEVRTGLSDSQFTELVSGELKLGDKLVIGIQPAVTTGDNDDSGSNTRRLRRTTMILFSPFALLSALAKNKARAGLTVLGVVIGIAAVTAMVSIGQLPAALVRGQFESIGTNVIVVFPGNQRQGGVRQGLVPTLTASDSDAMAKECPRCGQHAAGRGPGPYHLRQHELQPPRCVWRRDRLSHRRKLDTGQRGFFTDRDISASAKVCVIGHTLVAKLFQTSDPINQTIREKIPSASSASCRPKRQHGR
jgi:hypothetical protein